MAPESNNFLLASRHIALTEERNPISEDIDAKSSLEIVEIINREDARITKAVYEARASIATAIEWVTQAFRHGGRLFYVGAGTSGRLGILDASECPPTFGVAPELVQAVIAGGNRAMFKSVEGAEDDAPAGAHDLAERNVSKNDVVIGISSGSSTSYVRGAIDEAKKRGAKVIFLTCTQLKDRGDFADLIITVLTGPEVITGSTRMKAGTATKMVLNMISTGAMIRTGRTYGNLMVDLACSNRKLVARGTRILEQVTRLPAKKASALLKRAENQVKTALAMELLHVDKSEAEKKLREADGFLRQLLDHPHRKNPAVDAIFLDMDGTIIHYELPVGFSSWAAIGWALGIYNEQEEWVDQYLSGKIPFNEIWKICAQRIAGRTFEEIRDVLFPCSGLPPLERGFMDCMKLLRGHYRLGIISSGISLVGEEIRKTAGLDFEITNVLGMAQGKFDGSYDVRVPFNHKVDVVLRQAQELGLSLSRICFVGDSVNDIEVLRAVGFPVAYRPKTPDVAEAARGNVIGDFLQLPGLIESFRTGAENSQTESGKSQPHNV